jgi:hypothetical protein
MTVAELIEMLETVLDQERKVEVVVDDLFDQPYNIIDVSHDTVRGDVVTIVVVEDGE